MQSTSTVLIETSRASIDTLSVTIQALHISGKQMTLAVFRQLPSQNEPENAELWGVVRYDIKDQGNLWLVYSHEGSLFRRELLLHPPRYNRVTKRLIQEAEQELERHRQRKSWNHTPEATEKYNLETERMEEVIVAKTEQYKDDLAFEKTYYARQKEILAALPQLFIAV